MVSQFSSFSKLKPQKILVVGDLMLDTYTIGKARRISPEAPVPVLHVQREEHRPGGAGNVALNLAAMGAEVLIAGRIGNDLSGDKLRLTLAEEGIRTAGIVIQHHFPTPVKNRVIADNQQMVRVDYEQILPLEEQLEQQVIESLPLLLEGVKVVAVSDYGKGFITTTLMSALVKYARERGIPVIADPKGIDYAKYKHAHVLKPNLGEAYAAANLPLESPLEMVAARIIETTQVDILMITRSEKGIAVFYRDGCREEFPVKAHDVRDVTGAGDTVLATLALSLANNVAFAESARLCNVAASIAIERFGCARVTLSDLARRLLGNDVDNKVYDEGHLFALQEALKGREYTLLSLSSEDGLGAPLFSAIRKLAQQHQGDLLLSLEDLDPQPVFLETIASLHDVDYMIVKSGGIKHLCKLFKPSEVYELKNGELLMVDSSLSH